MFKQLLIAGFAIAAVAADLPGKANYLADIAPLQIQAIETYRGLHKNDLTQAQDSVLDLATEVVTKFDHDGMDKLVSACHDAFGEKECAKILNGPLASDAGHQNNKRDRCGCATLPPTSYCGGGAPNCVRRGTFGSPPCDYASCKYISSRC